MGVRRDGAGLSRREVRGLVYFVKTFLRRIDEVAVLML